MTIPIENASKKQQRAVPPTSTPQRLNANFRLSTACAPSTFNHHQQQQVPAGSSGSSGETGAQNQHRDWTSYSSSSFPFQQYQHQQQGLCSLVTGSGIYDQQNLSSSAASSLFATPSLPQSMTAAAATVVTKFEPGSQMSMATAPSSSSSIPPMDSLQRQATAAVIGRGHGLEPRMISTPPYYNPAANYAAASNAAYLYSPQNCYGLQQQQQQRTGSRSNATAPFHNYLAATNSAVAAAGCLNYGTAYGGGSAGTSLTDYYGFNYYSGGGSMLNPSSSIHDFGGSSNRTTGYCSNSGAGQNNSYKSSNNNRTVSNTISNINSTSDLNSSSLMGGEGLIGTTTTNSSSATHHQLSPLTNIKVEKTTITTATKRPKKRKLASASGGLGGVATGVGGVSTASPTQPNNTRVFVWELEDLCCVLASHPYRAVDTFMLQVIEQILRCAFLMEHLEECDQANIEDAEVEESMHESMPCNLLTTSTTPLNVLCSSARSNASTSDCGASSHASGSSPSTLLSLAQQPTNPSNSSASHNFSSITSTNNNFQITNAAMCELVNGNHANTPSTVNRGMLEGLRRIAAKYQHIKGTYERFKNNLSELLDFCGLSAQSVDIIERFQSYDKISGCQTERYKRCLKIINDRSDLIKDKCTNVVFTSESLASSLAKLMSFDLANSVPAENVYSTTKNGKEVMLARICERFKKQHIVIISSSSELGALAKKENIPFWKINNLSDVDALYFALDTILLADMGMSNPQSYSTQTKC
uniref:Eyes absent homolog n=1 Tax=Ditylenchus dipsaci TaxID=166011 RepID=A0A915DC20_9BILA